MSRFPTGRQMSCASLLTLAMVAAASILPARGADDVAPKLPSTILIIRHAEKPPDDAMLGGLSPKGEERAKLLYRLFEPADDRRKPLPKPDFVFATKATKNSRRPKLTIAPLSEKLHLSINDEFGKDEAERLAKELTTGSKYAGKTVLICWHHGTLPQLAMALGAGGAPPVWHGDDFDHVWRLDYDREGKVRFSVQRQRLLKGDAVK